MGQLWVGGQVLQGGKNLGHPGLVVRPQQGGAVGDDQILPRIAAQALVLLGAHGDALFGVLNQHAPLIADDAGLHVGARRVGRGVHVGDQAQAGHSLAPGGGGKPSVNIAVLVHPDPVEAHLGQLGGQFRPQHLLLGAAGHGHGVLVRLGVKAHILQKTFHNCHTFRSFLWSHRFFPTCRKCLLTAFGGKDKLGTYLRLPCMQRLA